METTNQVTKRRWRDTPTGEAIKNAPPVRAITTAVRMTFYYSAKLFRRPFMPRFESGGKTYEYFYSPLNFTYRNERIIEVAIAGEAFKRYPPDQVLEIGDVLAQYYHVPHDVVDKYDVHPPIMNDDVETFDTSKRYALIVSVSTLEHAGWDAPEVRDAEKIPRSIENLKRLLSPGGELLVTMPLGVNAFLDEYFEKHTLPLDGLFMKRISYTNRWKEVSYDEARGGHYDSPFPAANVVFVGKYIKPAGR